jgi:hypothetical protein
VIVVEKGMVVEMGGHVHQYISKKYLISFIKYKKIYLIKFSFFFDQEKLQI